MIHSLYGSLCPDPLTAVAALMDPLLTTKDTTFTKIFVGGLPYHTSDKTLRQYFEQFGDIEEAVVITDRQTGKSRGYGFVTMKERSSAERACKDPNPIIDGRKANVNLAYLGAKPRNNVPLGKSDGGDDSATDCPVRLSVCTFRRFGNQYLLTLSLGLPLALQPSAAIPALLPGRLG
ncbi:unnamed protein product [Soboliphyme baturini]|uniref:RRM domain-containing protein n=1 Tax=Soboliphyme baturini TaxID=241478 RepID=A0A183J685_9BILA|nr:unnamed protein product [Soboliphyme baturini]